MRAAVVLAQPAPIVEPPAGGRVDGLGFAVGEAAQRGVGDHDWHSAPGWCVGGVGGTWQPAAVLRAYLDESYSDDWFFMAAAISRTKLQERRLEVQFRALLRDEAERLAMPTPTEIHGQELFQGSGPWVDVGLHERLAVAGRVLQIVRDHDVRFVIRGIDRAAQRRKYPVALAPYSLVLTRQMKALNQYAGERKEEIEVTCDEIDKHDRHRAALERHRRQGTPGYVSSKLGNVFGELNFVKSTDSAMIQAADVVAYLRHRHVVKVNPTRSERRAREGLTRIVGDKVDHDYCWKP